tara:strand:- start:342 stop:920 length:579 start_codon:yes stop_codon:yes gene_type:complete
MQQTTKLKHILRFVCIDTASIRSKLPPYVRSVPCLIEGGTNKVLIGSDILEWIKHREISQNSQQRNIPPPPNNNVSSENGPNAWHFTEMSNFSDPYSFIDIDTSAKGNGGTAMLHSFEPLIGPTQVSRQNMPGGAPGAPSMPVSYAAPGQSQSNFNSYGQLQNSEKQDTLNRKMEQIMQSRDADVPNMPARI